MYRNDPSIVMPSKTERQTIHEKRDSWKSPLNVRTPKVSEKERKKWFGMPPTKPAEQPKRTDTVWF